jgi:hypothetical protein
VPGASSRTHRIHCVSARHTCTRPHTDRQGTTGAGGVYVARRDTRGLRHASAVCERALWRWGRRHGGQGAHRLLVAFSSKVPNQILRGCELPNNDNISGLWCSGPTRQVSHVTGQRGQGCNTGRSRVQKHKQGHHTPPTRTRSKEGSTDATRALKTGRSPRRRTASLHDGATPRNMHSWGPIDIKDDKQKWDECDPLTERND